MLIAVVTIAYLLVALALVVYLIGARDQSKRLCVRNEWNASVATLPKRLPPRPVSNPDHPEGHDLQRS
jgi:hypothetical protein